MAISDLFFHNPIGFVGVCTWRHASATPDQGTRPTGACRLRARTRRNCCRRVWLDALGFDLFLFIILDLEAAIFQLPGIDGRPLFQRAGSCLQPGNVRIVRAANAVRQDIAGIPSGRRFGANVHVFVALRMSIRERNPVRPTMIAGGIIEYDGGGPAPLAIDRHHPAHDAVGMFDRKYPQTDWSGIADVRFLVVDAVRTRTR
jgi:hypothetical protein